ncbi:hypothetical protein D9619_009798 [Psilocybe cf. subviscida]|uniref:FHA domain-containing protein n=1 Tax=Psilocybe cf. subviscida TaxID=2480587 RepID=A0A8H5BL98_9AGAR|nr:hypothetical protein D9619_009798 [Psilocybe cf. subviscida]
MAPKAGKLKKTLLLALEAAEAALDGLPIPAVKGCITGILMIVEQEELRKSNVEAFEKLLDKIRLVQDIVVKPLLQITPEDTPDRLKEDVSKFADKLRKLPDAYNKNRGTPSSTRGRIKERIKDFVNAGDNEELLKDLAEGIEDAIQFFQLSSDVTNQLSHHKTQQLLEADNLLRDLPEAPNGRRTEICEEGTRTSILLDATEWARSVDPGVPQVLWLHGPAGSGKSTVASTLVTCFFKEAILGGKFMFSRANGIIDAGLLFPTLARQLAQHDGQFKVQLGKSIQSNSKHLGTAPIAEQFEYLMLQPLLKLPPSRSVIVVVLDALDECDRRDDVEKIFSLLVDNIHRLPFLRIFVTSRCEDYIGRTAQRQQPKIRDIDINRTSATDDIRLYLRKKLFDPFTSNHQGVEGVISWPPPVDLEALVERSKDLFIYAATAVRFIMEGDAGDPRENLNRLLWDQEARKRNIFSSLDHMYSAIIRKALPEDAHPDTVDRFREIVGTVIFNPRPVSVNKLVKLSGFKYKARQVRVALQYLHSVIAVPDDDDRDGIHAYHKSFVDFITDPNRCTVKAASLNEARTYQGLFKRYMNALPETRGWTPSQIDCAWNFTNTQPQDFRAYLVELECYLDVPEVKYADSIRREFFMEGIKDQLCSPLPPAPLAISPKVNRDYPSEVLRRIDLVPLHDPSNPKRNDLRECDPPLCIGGMSAGGPGILGERVRFDSLVMADVHAEIFVDGDGTFFVKDTGMGQGTFLNDVRLSPSRRASAPHPLEHGDILQFGLDSPFGNTDEFKSVTVRVELQDNQPANESISAEVASVPLLPSAVDDARLCQQIRAGDQEISEDNTFNPALPGHLHPPNEFKTHLAHGGDHESVHRHFPFAWAFTCALICILLFEHSGREIAFLRFLHTLFTLESA